MRLDEICCSLVVIKQAFKSQSGESTWSAANIHIFKCTIFDPVLWFKGTFPDLYYLINIFCMFNYQINVAIISWWAHPFHKVDHAPFCSLCSFLLNLLKTFSSHCMDHFLSMIIPERTYRYIVVWFESYHDVNRLYNQIFLQFLSNHCTCISLWVVKIYVPKDE